MDRYYRYTLKSFINLSRKYLTLNKKRLKCQKLPFIINISNFFVQCIIFAGQINKTIYSVQCPLILLIELVN